MSRLFSLVALLVLISCAAAFAAAPATTTKPATQTKDGTIQSVDADAKSFVLTRDPRPLTFKVDEKTVITLDGKAATFTALKPHLKAIVTYTRAGDVRTATKVELTSAEAK
jgi:hypothetical protein